MRVLNIEDSPIKHKAIKNVLENCRITEIDNELTVFCATIVFMVIFVNGIFGTIKYSIQYILTGENLSARMIFFLLYIIYLYSLVRCSMLFWIITLVWFCYEFFISWQATKEVFEEKN